MQLAAAPGSPALAWSAGVWLSVSPAPGAATGWVDSSSGAPVDALPWCPDEPNNKGGAERCASLLTTCVQSGAAVNDFPCDSPLSAALCAFPSPDCGGERCASCWLPAAGWHGDPGGLRCRAMPGAGGVQREAA
jgi:hypothetical protein